MKTSDRFISVTFRCLLVGVVAESFTPAMPRSETFHRAAGDDNKFRNKMLQRTVVRYQNLY